MNDFAHSSELTEPDLQPEMPRQAEVPRQAEFLAIPEVLAALDRARRADRAREDNEAHRLVGQAVGILMERFEIADERALYCLQRVADAGRVDLRQVARIVVNRVNVRAETAVAEGDQPL